MIAQRFQVEGAVQGVGFRGFTQAAGRRLGLGGWVRNCSDGSVEGLVQGPTTAVEAFFLAIAQGPPAAQVRRVLREDCAPEPQIQAFAVKF